MSTREKLIKARLGLLALAQALDNVRLASKRAGISRSHFYEIKEAYEKYGAEGLAPQPRRRPRMPNQTPPELEQRILEMTGPFPTYSYVCISGQLRLIGVGVSPDLPPFFLPAIIRREVSGISRSPAPRFRWTANCDQEKENVQRESVRIWLSAQMSFV